jgi:hypothetical protein
MDLEVADQARRAEIRLGAIEQRTLSIGKPHRRAGDWRLERPLFL